MHLEQLSSKHKLFWTVLILNVILIAMLAFHWRYFAMKYNVMYTPALECDRLRFAYQLNNDDVFVPSDKFFEQNPDAKTFPEEVRQSLMLADLVTERSQQIEDICNAELSTKNYGHSN